MKSAGSSMDYDDNGASEDVDLHRFLIYTLKRLWIVAICLAVFLVAGFAYLRFAPKIFEATAIVEVPLEAKQVVEVANSESQDFRSEEVLKTIEKNLQRISLFRRVIDRKEIQDSETLRKQLGAPVDRFAEDELAGTLEEWTTARLESGTRLIKVSVENESPELAVLIANTVVDEFVRERVEMQSGTSASAFKFLLTEAEKARGKLETSEENLLQIHQFQDALALKEKIDSQKDIVLELSQRYRDKHPKLVQARSSLAALTGELRSQLIPPGSSAEFVEGEEFGDSGFEWDQRLEDELKLLEGRFNVLSREVEADRVLYESIVSRLKQTDVSQNWELIPLRVVQSAFAPSEPSKPNKLHVLGASVILGGGTGLGLVFLLCAMDRSLRTVEEAYEVVGLPVIGAVPSSRRLRDPGSLVRAGFRPIAAHKENLREREKTGARGSQPIRQAGRGIEPVVILSDPVGLAAEALRTVRAELGAEGQAVAPRSFLITSALPREGKSFVATNVAVSFAAEERSKTLLIDANLREPVVHALLDVKPSGGGLVEVLEGREDWQSVVVDSGVPHLDLMLAGDIMSNPAEFLSREVLSRLMGDLSQHYDRIVVDSTRVNSVADTLLIAPHVDNAILVVRAARTPRNEVRRARDLLADMGRRRARLVLNFAPS